jgi:hypothetical protein
MNYPALARAKTEIDEGKLGIARDRIHGLVLAYPCDLSLRSILGDVNMKLGYPREAGRWWFLEENLSPEQQEAVDMFIAECRGDASEVLRRLKVRCDPADLPTQVSKERIQAQIDACVQRGQTPPVFERQHPTTQSLGDRLFGIGCFLVLTICLLLMGAGAVAVYQWITAS